MRIAILLTTVFTFQMAMAADDSYPSPHLLIEPDQLVQLTGAQGCLVLDVRSKEQYAAGHVPHALWLNHDEWSKAFDHGLDAAGWSQRIGALGISRETEVVVYDDSSNKDAARIWWQLRYWGVEDVRLLNGGWTGWKGAGLTIDQTEVLPVAVTFEASAKSNRLATKEQLLESLKVGGLQIVDARSEKEYCGIEKLSNKRAGAIPGAKQLEWIDLIDTDSKRFKSAAELRQLFQEAGIDLTKSTATHCQSGGRASVMAFGLELMGAKDVSNYYSSWGEWSQADDTPVVPGQPQ